MANEFIIKKGLISKANSIVSGSLIVTDGVSGSFSGSFEGDGSGLTNVTASFSPTASYALTASYVNPLNQDVEITGSLAVNGDITAAVTDTARLGITLKPSTGITGVTQFAKIQDSNGNDIITRQQGTVNRPHELWIGRNTGYQGDNNIIINGPGSIGTPSFNQTNLGVTSLWVWQGANTYGQYITGKTQDATSTALLVRNWNGNSGVPSYETYFQLRNDKSVLISGSLEVTGSMIVTEGISGSFSGSFEGDGSGLTNVPTTTTASYALTASYVETAQTASYVLNAVSSSYSSFAVSASYAVSASHEIIKEVSSSYADTASFAQSGDGIFSGSFSGSFNGTFEGTYGKFGISDSSGSYTYYPDLSSSLQAAVAGDTIQLFTNVTEASDHTFHLKDKVDFNFNGNELFISASATLDAADMITDNDVAVSCSFYNGRIRFTQSTSAGIFNRLLYIDNPASEITSIGFEWEVENGTNATPFYPIRNDGTLNGGKFIGGPIFNYLIQTYGQLKNLDVYASKGIRFNGFNKKHNNLKVHTYGGQAGAETSQNYLYNSYFYAETGQALSIYYAINCDIRADNGAGISSTRQLIDSTVVNSNGIGVSSVGEMIGGSIYTSNNISLATSIGEILGVTIYNRDFQGPGITIGNGEISNCAIIDDYPSSGQKSIEVDAGATLTTISNCSFDFYNNNAANTAITAVDDNTPVFFANNTFKNCTPTNPTKVTQAVLNTPDAQGNIVINN